MSTDTDAASDAIPESSAESTEESTDEKQKLSLEVHVDKPSECKRHVTVSIARDDVERYLSKEYDDLKPKAEVPGFRPGRAPRKLVESRFKEQVFDKVKGELLMDSLTQVSEEQEFSAISEPDFDYDAVELPDEGPLTFEFELEVRPEFDLPEWKGLAVERSAHEVTDEEVEDQLQKLLEGKGTKVAHDGEIGENDFLTVDIRFKHEGKEVSEAKELTVRVRPVLSFADAKLEGFGELVTGGKAGDSVSGKLEMSSHCENEKLRGQELDVEISIAAAQKMELPEINEDFLQEVGGFEDEEGLRLAVRAELDRQFTYRHQQSLRRQITNLLTKDANWDLPQDMLRRQARRELERSVLELRYSGFSEDEIQAHENEIRQNSVQATETALKEHFIFERIAEDEEMDADSGDFDREIALIAMQRKESPRRVRAGLEKKGQMDSLRNQIIERKVIELIQEHAEFKDVPYEPPANDTHAVDFAIAGQAGDSEIPEAKHGEAGDESSYPASET